MKIGRENMNLNDTSTELRGIRCIDWTAEKLAAIHEGDCKSEEWVTVYSRGASVIRWCQNCGAIRGDTEFASTNLPGNLFPVMQPLHLKRY